MTDVAARIAAAAGDASALLSLAIELANENARLAGHAAALEDADRARKQAAADKKYRQRHGLSRDVPGQSGTSGDSEGPPPAGKEKGFIGSPPRAKATAPASPSAPRRPAGEPAFDLAPYLAAHDERFPGASVSGGRFGKALKPLEQRHGPAETLRRWRIFLRQKGELGPEYFARTWSEWSGEPAPATNGAAPRVPRATEGVIFA